MLRFFLKKIHCFHKPWVGDWKCQHSLFTIWKIKYGKFGQCNIMKLSHLKPLMVFQVFLWTSWRFFSFTMTAFYTFVISWAAKKNQSKVSCTGAHIVFFCCVGAKLQKYRRALMLIWKRTVSFIVCFLHMKIICQKLQKIE